MLVDDIELARYVSKELRSLIANLFTVVLNCCGHRLDRVLGLDAATDVLDGVFDGDAVSSLAGVYPSILDDDTASDRVRSLEIYIGQRVLGISDHHDVGAKSANRLQTRRSRFAAENKNSAFSFPVLPSCCQFVEGLLECIGFVVLGFKHDPHIRS